MSTDRARRPLYVLHSGFALTGVGTVLLGPILPSVTARWHLSDVSAGKLFSAQFVGALVATLCSSWLAARWGYRRTLIGAFALVAAGFAVAALASWQALVPAVFIYGAGLGTAIPVTSLIVASLRPGNSAASLNVLNFSWGAGAILCPPVAAAVAAGQGVSVVFVCLMIAAILQATALTIIPDHTAPEQRTQPAIPGRNTVLLAITAASIFLYVGAESTIAGWASTWAARLGAPASTAAIPTALFWSGIMAARLVAPAALRRTAPRIAILASLIVSGIGTGLMLAVQSIPGLLTGAALSGLGAGALFPTILAVYLDSGDVQAARSAHLVFASGALGGATVPVCAGWAGEVSGSTGIAMAFPALCLAFIGLLQVAIRRT